MRPVNNALKTALFLSVEALGINHVCRFLNRGRIKVLMLHSVCDNGPFDNALRVADFRMLLDYLQAHYNIVSMTADGEWLGLRNDMVNVLLTFDDGFIDNYENAAPILRERGLSAAFFLISECVKRGSAPTFTAKYGAGHEAELRTIDRDRARELVATGMIIGSHSTSHRDFSKLGDADVEADAAASKRDLVAVTARSVELFAFPWGYHRPAQLGVLLRFYRRIFTTEHGFNRPEDTVLRRNEVADLAQGYAATSGALDAMKRLAVHSERRVKTARGDSGASR
jgi:peptidoglycan/xylan/chitin deacetylase (PgdA/CDA1 family)